MKKFFLFLLAFVYIASCCEATVYLHYCMGKQVGFSLTPGESNACTRCGMKKAGKGMDCCKDEQKIIKSDKTQKVTDLSDARDQQKKFITISLSLPVFISPRPGSAHISHFYSNGPPSSGPVPVYLLNRVFRI